MSENVFFSYTKRDYEGSRKEGLEKIPVVSKGNWTDLNATDPGVIILDYVHGLVDMIQYYQDHQALETFITTAKERANIFRIAKQLSYKIRSAKGALCEVEFLSNLIYDYTLKIPRYTSVSTLSGTQYLTTEDVYLLAGEHRVSVICTQGTIQTVSYKGTGVSRFSNVPLAANQSITIKDQNVDIDSIVITDNIGRVWNPVDYIVFSTELDRVYEVELNPDNTITIHFGDGERGIIPQESDILEIKYITTLAEEGRVGAEEIVVLDNPVMNDLGQFIELEVINHEASTGGSQAQSSREIKEIAPGVIKAQDRAVTLNDFENLAKLVDGVADAKAYDINIKPDLCLHHEVKVLITPKDRRDSTKILEERVYAYLSERMIPPTNLQVLTPTYQPVDIVIEVKKLDTTTEGRLTYEIQSVITNYFNERAGAIGQEFYPSDLLSIIGNLPDVRYIISMTPNIPVKPEELSVLTLGSVHITVR